MTNENRKKLYPTIEELSTRMDKLKDEKEVILKTIRKLQEAIRYIELEQSAIRPLMDLIRLQ